MLLIFLAGVHALAFHWSVYRDVASWDDSMVLPVGEGCGFRFDLVMDWDCCRRAIYRIRVTLAGGEEAQMNVTDDRLSRIVTHLRERD